MPVILNTESGLAENLDPKQAQAALQSGSHEIPMVSPEGEFGSVPASEAQAALAAGFRQPNEQELAKSLDVAKHSTGLEQATTAVEGALSAATLGLAGPIQQSLIEKVDPRQAKQMFIEEQRRAEVNPMARMAGELIGLGATAGLGVGAAPVMELAGQAAARGIENKIGSMAAKLAVENMVFQAGSEVDKHFWQNADSVQSALVEVGLAGVLGGITGAGLGSIKELWKLGPGKQLEQTLEGLKAGADGVPAELAAKANLNIAPELSAAMGDSPAAQRAAQKLMDSGTASGEHLQNLVKGVKQDISEGLPNVLGQSMDDISKYEGGIKLKDSLTAEMKKVVAPIAEKYEKFEEKFAKQILSTEDKAALGDMVSDIMAKSGILKDPYSAEAALYRRMSETLPLQENLDDLRKVMSRLADENPFGKDTYQAAKQLRTELQGAFENILERKVKTDAPELLAEFAQTKGEYRNFKELLSDLNDRLHMGKRAEGGIKGFVTAIEEMKPEQLAKRLNLREDVGLQKLLSEKFPDVAEMRRQQEISELIGKSMNADKTGVDPKKLFNRINEMQPEYKNYLISADQQQRLEAVQEILARLPEGANTSRTAKTLMQQITDLLPGAGGLAGGVASGHPFLGMVVGMLASKGPAIHDAARLAMLKFIGSPDKVSGPGFKAAVEMAQAVIRGETKMQQAAAAVVGRGNMPAISFAASDRDKLQKRIDELVNNPQDALNVGGDIGHYLPDHASMVALSGSRAVQYLQSIKPQEQSPNLLGKPLPVSDAAKANYNRALEIANNPQVILRDIKEGTLTPKDMQHIGAMYPELLGRMQQHLQTQLIEAKNDGINVPFKVQQAMSLFLNQPIHGLLQPQSIQAAQPMPQQQPPSMAQMPKLKNVNKLDKLPGMFSTSVQHREATRTGNHR